MVARVLVTAIPLLLALYGFWGDILGAGHVLNPFGVLFLLLGALVWFAWEPIREGFWAAKNESEIPISRLGATIIRGMRRVRPRRRSDPD